MAGLVTAVFLIGMTASAATSLADSGETASLFAAGNQHYAAGEYEKAVLQYRQLLNQGYLSEAVHYNLGNALFKAGRLGEAILEYEKAARLAPWDRDLAENLEYVRTLTVDEPSETGARTTAFFVERSLGFLTVDQSAVLFTVSYLIMGGLVGLRILSASPRSRRVNAWLMAAVGSSLVAGAAFFGAQLYRTHTVREGIVLEARVDVRSGPGEDNTTLFTVHEGLKVRVRDRRGTWVLVSLANGLNGWMPGSSLGEI